MAEPGQAEDACARPLGVVESREELTADEEGRNGPGLLPQAPGHLHIEGHMVPVAGELEVPDLDPGLLLAQPLQEGQGIETMGTAFGPKDRDWHPNRPIRVLEQPGAGLRGLDAHRRCRILRKGRSGEPNQDEQGQPEMRLRLDQGHGQDLRGRRSRETLQILTHPQAIPRGRTLGIGVLHWDADGATLAPYTTGPSVGAPAETHPDP